MRRLRLRQHLQTGHSIAHVRREVQTVVGQARLAPPYVTNANSEAQCIGEEETVITGRHTGGYTAATIPRYLAPICDVDGSMASFHYADSGEDDMHTTKVPLVLIPGSAQNINSWGPHVKAISKWRRLIIPEFRCQGLTTTLRPEFSSVTQLMADLTVLIDQLELKECDLCGFSLGGRIAMAYGASENNRARKVSVTGVPLVRPPLGRTIMQSWAEGLEQGEMIASCWSFLINGYSTGFLEHNRAHLGKFVEAVAKANDVQRLKHLFRFSMSEHPDDYNSVTSCVSRIKCPLQVVGGSDDRICAIESMVALHENVPHSTLVVMANTGHLVPFEQPAQWRQQLLQFLDS